MTYQELLSRLKKLEAAYDDAITHIEGRSWPADQASRIDQETSAAPDKTAAWDTALLNLEESLKAKRGF